MGTYIVTATKSIGIVPSKCCMQRYNGNTVMCDVLIASFIHFFQIQLSRPASSSSSSSPFFIHIFTTHMQATYNNSSVHHNKINDRMRWGQVVELAEFVKSKTADCDGPVIIAGMNIVDPLTRDLISSHLLSSLLRR